MEDCKAHIAKFNLSGVCLNVEVALLQLHFRILRCEERIFDNSLEKDKSLQDLDFIAQSLGALAQFLGSVASEIREDHVIDLRKPIEKVVLESLADVLSSDAPSEKDIAKLAGLCESNGVDLF